MKHAQFLVIRPPSRLHLGMRLQHPGPQQPELFSLFPAGPAKTRPKLGEEKQKWGWKDRTGFFLQQEDWTRKNYGKKMCWSNKNGDWISKNRDTAGTSHQNCLTYTSLIKPGCPSIVKPMRNELFRGNRLKPQKNGHLPGLPKDTTHHCTKIFSKTSLVMFYLSPMNIPILQSAMINGLVYGKIYRKTPYLMVKTMVSCKFSLKPIHWHERFRSVFHWKSSKMMIHQDFASPRSGKSPHRLPGSVAPGDWWSPPCGINLVDQNGSNVHLAMENPL